MAFFQYYPDIIIAAAYTNFIPLVNSVCVVLMEDPILANSLIILYIDAWFCLTITTVAFLYSSSLMVSSRIVIVSFNF